MLLSANIKPGYSYVRPLATPYYTIGDHRVDKSPRFHIVKMVSLSHN